MQVSGHIVRQIKNMKIREVIALFRQINGSMESKTGQHGKIITAVRGQVQIQIRCQIIKTGQMTSSLHSSILDQTTGQRTEQRPNHIIVSGHTVRQVSIDKYGHTFGYKMDGQVQGSGNQD
jgi:hypothetical protein